jgi:hypothetical protein
LRLPCVWGDPGSEVSGTAKAGTDEQELHKRLFVEVELAHLNKGRNQQFIGSRCSRDQRKEGVLTQGSLRGHSLT